MDNEQIKAELAAKRQPGALLARVNGLAQQAAALVGAGVPSTVRAVLEQAHKTSEYSRHAVIARNRAELGAQLGELSDDGWRRLAQVLLPRLESSAVSALHGLVRRPYTEGLTRRPLRAPQSRTTLAGIRGRWLASVALLLGDYDADIVWIAEHGAHLAGWSGAVDLGWLLAGAIDAGGAPGDAVFEVLASTVRGDHPTSQMGRHVTQALLSCARPDAWELVERLLLAAQREEGLRQVILESVDESHPGAFRRIVTVIHEHDLARFSSVIRAADTWFGFLWDGTSQVRIDTLLGRVLTLLDDPAARDAALNGDDAETAYLALWCVAFDNVDAAIPLAAKLAASSSESMRFVAAHILVQSLWSSAFGVLTNLLGDADLRVAARALDGFFADRSKQVDVGKMFDRLEQLIARIPKRGQVLETIVWPWWKHTFERSHVAAAMVAHAASVPGERLLPHVRELNADGRAGFLRSVAGMAAHRMRGRRDEKRRTLTAGERALAVDFLGDASESVRSTACDVLDALPLEPDEVERIVDLLDRKASDLRARSLVRLRALSDAELLSVADRLLADSSEPRREAGLELLRDATEKKRSLADVRARIERYSAGRATLSKQEEAHVAAVLREPTVATTDDALGLIDPHAMQEWPAPKSRGVQVDTAGARASIAALAELVLANAETEVRRSNGEVVLLPQSVGWSFGPRKREDVENGGAGVPLVEVWRSWARGRPMSLRDDDGLELLRALVPNDDSEVWDSAPVRRLRDGNMKHMHSTLLHGLVAWSVVWDPPAHGFEFLIDGLESALAAIDEQDYADLVKDDAAANVWHYAADDRKLPVRQKLSHAQAWLNRARWWRSLFPKTVQPEAAARAYGALRALESRSRGRVRLRVSLDDFLNVYRAGALRDPCAELTDLLVGRCSGTMTSDLLRVVSTKRPAAGFAEHAELIEAVDRCRRRIVEVECERGDRPTAVSRHVMELRWTGGLDTLARALPALGKTHFARNFGWSRMGESRKEALSHLVVRSSPRSEDTLDAFAAWAKSARIPQSRLVELAVYAPQWAAHVNHVLEWPGLDDGVWWIEAHTKDGRSWQLRDLKDEWAAAAGEHTPLSADELTDGAVDVEWFDRTYKALGAERWRMLYAAAKYAASSGGHSRAQLFADAMYGAVTRDAVLARIDGKRHQDSVRALGLLPLAAGAAGKQDLLERYVRLENFRRESRKFGSQRQQSEKRAVTIGLANLARTAGYRDPQRLTWAMEQQAVADLVRGPLVLTRGDVTLTLGIDADGVPSLVAQKKGKTLKAFPASLKKDDDAQELKERLQELKRQRSRVRTALEEAMCRGDAFTAAELGTLLEHPILAPSVGRLVLVGDGSAGYPAEGGRVLLDAAGAAHALGNTEEVRIAHPHDLFARGDWSAWQRECFRAERVQPFKQVFRELYPITDTERGTERTRRYAGHQVNPRQALALLGGRGWLVSPDEGVSRTFHDAGLTARLGFEEAFFTPADIEGLTLAEVIFAKKGDWTPLALDQIPPRVFSETMRDLDLVVSVAHSGGVDPEATASTVEMRATLIGETCQLLGLDNVELKAHHAIVRGELGTYSVHLGSAGVMLMPATAIPIVAVHSQHRGRLFLPFADDDPRTAEVLSKVLLLARDRSIRDANILDRIRSASGTTPE